MKFARYVSLFVLLTVATLKCRAQVNVFDVTGGGGTDIQGLSSTNEGSQVANTINSDGSNAPQQSPQNLQQTYPRHRASRPNRTFEPTGSIRFNENVGPYRNVRPYEGQPDQTTVPYGMLRPELGYFYWYPFPQQYPQDI